VYFSNFNREEELLHSILARDSHLVLTNLLQETLKEKEKWGSGNPGVERN
jgi:hypothetical protein